MVMKRIYFFDTYLEVTDATLLVGYCVYSQIWDFEFPQGNFPWCPNGHCDITIII